MAANRQTSGTAKRVAVRGTLDQLPSASQRLKLACVRCGRRHTYDVGTVFVDQEVKEKSGKSYTGFAGYFRCQDCGSAGPWQVAENLKLLGWAMRAAVDRSYQGFVTGCCTLFDGTLIQTPAMGEDHLRALLDKNPQDAFLCTRLGNLFRGCHRWPQACEWYERALALDPGDVEARYHLYSVAIEN